MNNRDIDSGLFENLSTLENSGLSPPTTISLPRLRLKTITSIRLLNS